MPEVPEGFPRLKQPRLSKRKRTERIWAARKATRVVLLEELLMRSHGDCELGTPACTGRGEEVHHALRRSQGGQDVPEDTRWTCTACHSYTHAHVAEAFERGWLIRKELAGG